MYFAKIHRSAYLNLNQAALSDFAKTVVNNIFEEAAYADVKDYTTDLKAKSEAFESALILAADGGKEAIHLKNLAKAELLKALKELADELDYFARGNTAYLIKAGFTLRKKPEAFKGTLLTPTDLTAKSTGVPGQLMVTCKIPQRSLVKMTALEWSIDNVNWNNGTYPSSSRFVVKGLPSGASVMVRLCALGTSERKSDWSAPVTARVL